MSKSLEKDFFKLKLKEFANELKSHITNTDGEWSMKWFIDEKKTIFWLSSDTKLLSKIFEIHIFPAIVEFAITNWYNIEFTEHQNHYPDLTFYKIWSPEIRFAIDLKTTYKDSPESESCNWFTLWSHGEYFINRLSTKNIRYPYGSYLGHFILGIIYVRKWDLDLSEIKRYKESELMQIPSVATDFTFFACEKWEIASDKWWSWNTANIGSIKKIADILWCKWTFCELWESWFDEYWMNYWKITIQNTKKPWETKKIANIKEFQEYRWIIL